MNLFKQSPSNRTEQAPLQAKQETSHEDRRDTLCITALIQAYIPEASLKENSGSELTYMIPPEAEKASFKGLCQALDEKLQYLHVTGYGISDTTLEEVCFDFTDKKQAGNIFLMGSWLSS
uniref:ATP-binding cassette sub- A member 13 n=1 Tax=Sphaerodactylus townsendi TaxID=933632 RepID=A0ACB8FTZ4_9SAUR